MNESRLLVDTASRQRVLFVCLTGVVLIGMKALDMEDRNIKSYVRKEERCYCEGEKLKIF